MLNGGTRENCGLMDPRWRGWRDFMCSRDIPVTCACEHPGQMYLQLRGLCPESRLDRFYVPRNMRWSGLPVMVGLRSRAVNESFTVPGGGLTIDLFLVKSASC